MRGIDAMRQMVDGSGLSQRGISVALGHAPTYISTLLAQGSSPSVDGLALVAAATGYRIEIVGHGETLAIGDEITSDDSQACGTDHQGRTSSRACALLRGVAWGCE